MSSKQTRHRSDKQSHGNERDAEVLLIRGRHEVFQMLESGKAVEAVIISAAVRGAVVKDLRQLASQRRVPLKELKSDVFTRRYGDKSQGIVAIAGAFQYSKLEDLADQALAGNKVLVALNQVEDARNLGAIVRTVEASGCCGVIIPKHRSASMNEWAIRTAQGAAAYLPVSKVGNLADALEFLKKQGFWAVGLDGGAEKTYTDVVYTGPIVLVAGGEDVGLGVRVAKACDDLVSIPLAGKTPSLNVSVSIAAALFEVLRQKDFFQNKVKK